MSTNAKRFMTPHPSDFGDQAEGAVHYLRSPAGTGRFAQPIERARQRRPLDDGEDLLARQILQLSGHQPKLLVGERHHRLYPLDIQKVDYIEADGNYVTIRAGSSEYISRDSIKRLSADLAPFGFVRIDRSILLNIRAVAFAEPVGRGILAFTLGSGACLHSSRTYRASILRVLPWHHCRAGADAQEWRARAAISRRASQSLKRTVGPARGALGPIVFPRRKCLCNRSAHEIGEDRIAQCRTPFVVQNTKNHEIAQLSGAAAFAPEIAACPTRYVLADDLYPVVHGACLTRKARAPSPAPTCSTCRRSAYGWNGARRRGSPSSTATGSTPAGSRR